MKTIVCDVDSTICDHWNRIRRNTIPRWPGEAIHSKAFTREEVLKDLILPDCASVLNTLDEIGYKISYLTARGWENGKETTIEQLTRFELPNPIDVIVTDRIINKHEILKRNPPNFYIDDFMTGQENNIGTFHKEVAKEIQELGVNVVVFRNDWNDVYKQITLWMCEQE